MRNHEGAAAMAGGKAGKQRVPCQDPSEEQYDTDEFDATIVNWAAHYRRKLAAGIAAPDREWNRLQP